MPVRDHVQRTEPVPQNPTSASNLLSFRELVQNPAVAEMKNSNSGRVGDLIGYIQVCFWMGRPPGPGWVDWSIVRTWIVGVSFFPSALKPENQGFKGLIHGKPPKRGFECLGGIRKNPSGWGEDPTVTLRPHARRSRSPTLGTRFEDDMSIRCSKDGRGGCSVRRTGLRFWMSRH